MLDKKIFILINSDREFDYYNTLLKKLPQNFSVILNDHKKQKNYNNFKSLKIKKYYKLSEFLKNSSNEKLPILLSTGLGHLNIITIKSFLKFIYSRTFGLLISELNIDKFFYKKFKRKFTAGSKNCEIYDKIQLEKSISKVSICFPRGLDLNTLLYPEKRWRENFDYFLAHSYLDKKIIEQNAKKIVKVIGYPRYIKRKKDRINTKIKKILWIPSYPKFSKDKLFNITNWLPAFQKLNKKYNITIKFHPKIILDKKTRLFFSKHINVIVNPKQNLSELYDKNDLVVCDYGGSIFSAVYNRKPLVLLNNEISKFGLSDKNLEIILRDNFYSLEKFDNENLIKTINDMNKNYHKEYMKIKKLKNEIFGVQKTINEIFKDIIKLSNNSI